MQYTQNTTSHSWTTGAGSAARQNNAWQPLIYGKTKFKPSSSQKTAPNKSSLPLAARKNVEKLTNAMTASNTPGQLSQRPKLLGTFVSITRQHVASNKTEEQQINKALTSLKWVSQLPHRWQAKAAFAKATGLATAAATTYCRLPPLKAIDPLSTAITNCYGNGYNSNLFRLFGWPFGRPTFPHRCNSSTTDTSHGSLLATISQLVADQTELRPTGSYKQMVGSPRMATHKTCHGHGAIHSSRWYSQQILPTTMQQAAVAAAAALPNFELHKVGDPSALGHHLREGWRAQRWAGFLRSNTRAAAALAPHYGSWSSVADRAKEASRAWNYARMDLQAHVRAITTDQYISQLRLRSNQGTTSTTVCILRSSTSQPCT